MKTNKAMLCVLGSMLLFTVAAASAADAPKLTFKFTTLEWVSCWPFPGTWIAVA